MISEPADQVIVAPASAQFRSDSLGIHVKDDAVVVFESSEFPEIQHMKLFNGVADEESVQRIKAFYRSAQKREAVG